MSLLRRSPLPVAFGACLGGLALCGAIWVVAGPTPQGVADPLDPLPADVVATDQRLSCLPDNGGGVTGTCYQALIVRSTRGESKVELAQRMVEELTDHDYTMSNYGGPPGGDLSWFGQREKCGGNVFVSTSATNLSGIPGFSFAPGETGQNGVGTGDDGAVTSEDPSGSSGSSGSGGAEPTTGIGDGAVPAAGVTSTTVAAPTPTDAPSRPGRSPSTLTAAGPTSTTTRTGRSFGPPVTAAADPTNQSVSVLIEKRSSPSC